MHQDLRKKTKFIYFRIMNNCAKNGNPGAQNSVGLDNDRRKDIGPLNLPPASRRSRS